MICQRLCPPPDLRDFIREYLLLHMYFPEGSTPPVKAYPVNPEEGITIILDGHLSVLQSESGRSDERHNSYIFGQPSIRQNLILTPHFRFIHIRFESGTLFRFFRFSLVHDLRQPIAAADVFGPAFRQLEEQLKNASYAEIPDLLNRFFRRMTAHKRWHPSPFDAVPVWMRHNPSSFHLRKLASQSCMSERQFEKKFLQQVGVRPKLYARISRFYEAYLIKERQPQRDWLSIALDCGYNDYQHLAKDFKAFSSGTPNALMRQSESNPERRLQLATDFVGV